MIIERPELEGSYAEQIVVSEDGEEVCRLGLGERSFIECPVGRHVFDIRTRNEAIKARITIKDRRDSAKFLSGSSAGMDCTDTQRVPQR